MSVETSNAPSAEYLRGIRDTLNALDRECEPAIAGSGEDIDAESLLLLVINRHPDADLHPLVSIARRMCATLAVARHQLDELLQGGEADAR